MKAELREFIAENYLFGQPASFGDEDSFQEAGIIDSTGVLELVAFIEERYGIVVTDEELLPENLDSISRLERFLKGKQAASQAVAA